MAFTAQTLNNITSGSMVSGPAEKVLSGGICTDSRHIVPGCVFFALSGERFDGNDFAPDASQKGAGAVVVSKQVEGIAPSCAVILVPDVLLALQQAAAWWRGRLSSLWVVGITGSSGKTSTKDLTLAVLSEHFRVTATKGNLNNHIGLPLSVLKAEPSDEAAIWEMGMNHAGELKPLCDIARPQIGIISSIGSAHIEFFGSREAIAREKCTLPASLPAEGVMIYPADCEFADMIHSSTSARCVTVGIGQGDVRADNCRPDADGTSFELVIDGFCHEKVSLPLHGRHMVSNALLAAAAGWVLGMKPEEIANGLQHVNLTGGRLKCSTERGIRIIDDTYNANPESMKAALETVGSMECEGRRWAVLGRMGELGPRSEEFHFEIGRCARDAGFDCIISIGQGAQGISLGAESSDGDQSRLIRHFDSTDEASAWLPSQLSSGDLVLFKGSRSAGIDRLIHSIFPPSNDK